MAHAHHHLGADKVVKAEVPHASAEMNVTPLIDVLLVLLVIFMATLPLGQRGMDINLPAETKRNTPDQELTVSQVMVEYNAEKQISVNKEVVTLSGLEAKLRSIYETRKDKKMFIWGAETLRYREIIDVLDAAKGAGVEQIGVVTAGMRRAAGVASN